MKRRLPPLLGFVLLLAPLMAVAAAAALVSGILAVQEAAKSTIEDLDKLGMSDLITPEQRAAVAETEAALTAVKTAAGLLAVELAVSLGRDMGQGVSHLLAAAFFAISVVFVYRSFYGMRIGSEAH